MAKKTKQPTTRVSIFHLAVLRAAVEGLNLNTYFASLVGFASWVDQTVALGLVDPVAGSGGTAPPSPLGTWLYQQLDLRRNPPAPARAYLWPRALDLEDQATKLLVEKLKESGLDSQHQKANP